MFKYLLTGLLCILLSQSLICQVLLKYSFQNCGMNEVNNLSGSINNARQANCTCGTENEGLVGSNQSLSWPSNLDSFFRANFSFGFSVRIDNLTGEVDLFSKSRTCNSDTVLSITYRTQDSNFIFSFREGFDEIVNLAIKAEPNRCWQQLFLTRNNGDIRVYLNGKLAKQQSNNFILRLDNFSPLSFNSSDCQRNNLSPFQGSLDEVILANYAMISSEVAAMFVHEQEILTRDTTIFLGDQFNLRAQSNCPAIVQWSPTSGLTNADKLITLASPVQTTTYQILIQVQNCIVRDQVLVRVVDKDKLECESLLLPTAFSPNQDNLNDEFGISNPYLIEQLEYFEIIDKNGGIVYSSNIPEQKWNGSFKGGKLNPGYFVYRISYTCKDKNYKKSGSVYLLK